MFKSVGVALLCCVLASAIHVDKCKGQFNTNKRCRGDVERVGVQDCDTRISSQGVNFTQFL